MPGRLQLPKGWTSERLKDVAAVNASALSAGTDPEYEFDYLEISNVDYHGIVEPNAIERLRFEDAPSRARRLVRRGSTVVSSVRPNLQAVAHFPVVQGDFVCSTGFNVVEAKPNRLWPQFAYYLLISENARQNFEAAATGVGYPAIGDKEFNALVVPLPPLPEQLRIAAYLNTSCAAIDAAVTAKRQQLETLDALRMTTIQHAVTKGIGRDVELKDSGIDWLPAIPKHWSKAKLKHHVQMIRGQFSHRPRNDPAFYDGPYPFIQTGSISAADKFITEFSQTLNEDGLRISRLFPADTVVMTITGAKIAEVAVTTFEACFPDSIVGFIPRHSLHRDYLFYLLIAMKPALLSAMVVTTQPNINYVQIGGNYIPVPPVEEQEVIAMYIEDRIQAIREIRDSLNQQIATLTAYRKSLIHECVTGQRRITDADVVRSPLSERTGQQNLELSENIGQLSTLKAGRATSNKEGFRE